MKKLLKQVLRSLGYDIVRFAPANKEDDRLADLSATDKATLVAVRPFTMTSDERLAALINSVKHICRQGVSGDFVECGVWRGGSMMAAALTLIAEGDTSRDLYLYDTFTGMPPPTEHDLSIDGQTATALLKREPRGTGIWCEASLADVRQNIFSTGYPKERIHLIEGKVEDTIPKALPAQIAVLRLDTDWYESTKHELQHLFPLLTQAGVLILDDYGHWQGARTAVDEYFQEHGVDIFLHRVDYTGRIAVRSFPSARR